MRDKRFKVRCLKEPNKGEVAEVTVFPNGTYQVTGKKWGVGGPGPVDEALKARSFERLPEELDIFDCLEEIEKEDSL